jgi:multidrug efflux system outer membrane protein
MLLSQRAELKAEASLVKDLEELRHLEAVRFHQGANNIATLISVEQQVAQERTKIPTIQSVIAQSENTIHLLLNENPGPILAHKKIQQLPITGLIPTHLPASVLRNRPDIMLAAAEVKSACAQAGIAYAAFFPTLSLTGLGGHASFEVTRILKLSTNLWLAEASAVAKLLDLSAYKNVGAAKANVRATYYRYFDTLHRAFADVDNALTAVVNTKRGYMQTDNAYHAARQTYTIARVQYKAGATDYRNVVNAKINLDRSLLNLIQAKAQLLDSVVQVYTAVAGGYDAV